MLTTVYIHSYGFRDYDQHRIFLTGFTIWTHAVSGHGFVAQFAYDAALGTHALRSFYFTMQPSAAVSRMLEDTLGPAYFTAHSIPDCIARTLLTYIRSGNIVCKTEDIAVLTWLARAAVAKNAPLPWNQDGVNPHDDMRRYFPYICREEE
jgi:hypothetical protein